MADILLRHGIFIAPFHYIDESPTISMRRDLELVQWLDQLGYQEAWYGEHHSGGFETISSPELMIAAAAEMTKRIKLGTGVVSLTYHNPLMVANRILQLDHMTMGRIMFGVGPGLLPTDGMMLGVDAKRQRDRMLESLDAILRLFKGEEVTSKTDWFTLDRAKTHLRPYSRPYPEVVVASAFTPSGGMNAGKYGVGMLCVAATGAEGFAKLGSNWEIAKQVAAQHGNVMDPQTLRLVGPMHIAETRDKARENVKFGLERWCHYLDNGSPLVATPWIEEGSDLVDKVMESKFGVIGTPADAIEQIERLQAQQGEFGAFLQLEADWADWDATKKSYELYARYVMPHFAKSNETRKSSYEYLLENAESLKQRRQPGMEAAIAKWEVMKKGLGNQ